MSPSTRHRPVGHLVRSHSVVGDAAEGRELQMERPGAAGHAHAAADKKRVDHRSKTTASATTLCWLMVSLPTRCGVDAAAAAAAAVIRSIVLN